MNFFKSWFYAIKTGDGKAKAFYIMAFVAFILAIVGIIAGVVGFIPTVIAGQASFIPLGIAIISLVILVAIIVWLNKLRSI